MGCIGGSQCFGPGHAGHISRQRHTVTQLTQLCSGLVAGGGLARRDVNPCALGQETGGNHAANTPRAACDEGGSALQ